MNEEAFLTRLFGRQEPVTVYLMNGFRLHGVITGSDDAMVWIKADGKLQAIYKHAISTIVPVREIKGESGDKEVKD